MRWRSAISTAPDTPTAVSEVCTALGTDEPPDLLFVFADSSHDDDVAARVLGASRARHLVGCSAAGVIGDGSEVERSSALAVAAAWLPGASLEVRCLQTGDLPVAGAPASEWTAAIGIPADRGDDFVLLVDPLTFDGGGLIAGLDRAYPASNKIGGLASHPQPVTAHRLFVDGRVERGGAVVLAVGGSVAVDALVAQGCRPIGDPMFVTGSRQNLVLSLDGKPALESLRAIYARLDVDDRSLFRHSLFVGLAMHEERNEFHAGDFLVRNLIGADAENGALAVGGEIHDGQVLQFHLRDARSAARDLEDGLVRYLRLHDDRPPDAALLFSCVGRGAGLYGRPGHDSDLARSALGPLPLAGFFANGEIGPVGGRTFLHGYTSCFALFRRR